MFESGKINIVKGSNGSGKTTLFLILNKIDCDFIGTFSYFENEVKKEYSISDVVYVPSKNCLITYYDLEHNLNIFKTYDINLFCSEYNIEQNTLPCDLSGGEQEIVSLYRVKDLKDKIILLDESTSYLDDKNFDKMLDIIDNLSLNNLVIFATHDVRVLAKYSTIYHLINGDLKKDD